MRGKLRAVSKLLRRILAHRSGGAPHPRALLGERICAAIEAMPSPIAPEKRAVAMGILRSASGLKGSLLASAPCSLASPENDRGAAFENLSKRGEFILACGDSRRCVTVIPTIRG